MTWEGDSWAEAFRGIALNNNPDLDMAEMLIKFPGTLVTLDTLKLVAERINTLRAVVEQNAIVEADTFVVVRAEDWEGLYRNGELVTEGHHVGEDVYRSVPGLDLRHIEPTDEEALWNGMPEALSAIPKEWYA